MTDKSLVCIEYYGDTLCEMLVAAIDAPRNKTDKAMQDFGRALCRLHGLNAVEARIVDQAGAEIGRGTVWRR